MRAPWVLRHAVDIDGHEVRAVLPMPDGATAARLAWQLVALGGTVSVEPVDMAGGHCGNCGSGLYTDGTCPVCDRRPSPRTTSSLIPAGAVGGST